MNRVCGARLDAGGTGETIRGHPVLLKDGLHDRRGTCLDAGITGSAGVVIDLHLKKALLFDDPTHQPEGTEEVAPGPVNKERGHG